MTSAPSLPANPHPVTPVAALRQLSCRFGRTWALRDVDLDLRQGEIFGLLGANGAGKTTLLRVVMGLVKSTSGDAQVLGRRSRTMSAAALAAIGYVSEEQDLPGWMSLRRLIRQLSPLYPTWDEAFCDELCQRFGLTLDRPVRTLSRGHRMRVRLVLALAYRPLLLVLDEPFAGLDPRVRSDVIDGILELTSQARWTVLLATHELSIVERLADRVGFLRQGRMLVTDDLERLQNRWRSVQVDLAEPLPAGFSWPDSWYRIESNGQRLRFLDANAGDDSGTDRYASILPGFTQPRFTEVGLEEIYLALDHAGPSGPTSTSPSEHHPRKLSP